MTVYIDYIFLINYCMDFLLLFCTMRLTGLRIKKKKLCLGALLGAVYACLAVIFGQFLYSMWAKVIVSAIMTFLCSGFYSLKSFIKSLLSLWFVGAFFGGVFYAILLTSSKGSIKNGMFYFDIPIWLLISVALICTVWAFIESGGLKKVKHQKTLELTICAKGEDLKVTALYDSGNLLVDPYSGLPVIVVEKNCIAEILNKIPEENMYPFTYKSASGSAILSSFIPDYIIIKENNACLENRDVLIGAVNTKLSVNGEFAALIGGMCFDRAYKTDKKITCKAFRRRSFLHRGLGSSATAPDSKRGGFAFKKAFRG